MYWVMLAVAVLAIVAWAANEARKLGLSGRCPTCGRRVERVPHHPRCRYWRDR